ncbi:MAG: IS3 family transposase [Cyanobium sp.]
MARIDALYLEDPCSGSRRMVDYLAREGIPISRDRVRNLMRRMGLRAIYRKPRTTVPGDPAERFPCLVDLNTVTDVDQVWATDITYIPLQKGFLYLVAIVDLFSRNVLSWKLSNSLDTEFCLDALEMALGGGRKPEIFLSIKATSSPLATSWRGCRLRRLRSAGPEGSAATTTSWWRGCGERSSMRKPFCSGI